MQKSYYLNIKILEIVYLKYEKNLQIISLY